LRAGGSGAGVEGGVVAGAVVMKRNREYGSEGASDDDFDFDKYEGFDK
jgi:hypothetical protein